MTFVDIPILSELKPINISKSPEQKTIQPTFYLELLWKSSSPSPRSRRLLDNLIVIDELVGFVRLQTLIYP